MKFIKIQFRLALFFILVFFLPTVWAGGTAALYLLEDFSIGFEKSALPQPEIKITGIKLKNSQIILSPAYPAQKRDKKKQAALVAPKADDRATELPLFAFSRTTNDISAFIEAAIDDTSQTIEVALYGITLPNVAQALVRAMNRGVNVRVIINQKHVFVRRSEEIQCLIDSGVNIRTIRGLDFYGVMHNKIGIFDNRIMSTGSFNWVVSANVANTENIVFSADSKMIKGYSRCFEWMWTNSRSLEDGQDYENYPPNYFGPAPADTRPSLEFNSIKFPSYSFSPRGSTQNHIIAAIKASKKKISATIFSFYSLPVAEALIEAAKRGVDVRMVIDKVQASQSSAIKYVWENGVKLRWTRGHNKGVMHHKYSVMDDKLLMTGSFNWSNNAQNNNFENMFYTTSDYYIRGFEQEFDEIYEAAYTPTAEDLAEMESDSFDRNFRLSSDDYPDPSDPYIEFSN
ncbi:MAG: phospholipase D-like domain-containing protein [Elusimicrobia bacterium]|nr:phospholipase D-like domain-containing protein [Elusimicrobiota bacterium]